MRYTEIRQQSLALCEGLETEDAVVQSFAQASPLKWHLAHTTWFFETWVLAEKLSPQRWDSLFNSYYFSQGEFWPKTRRGVLSRPTLREILEYRERVDERMEEKRARPENLSLEARARIEAGLQHEQQHQELMLADLLHLYWSNPLRPAYSEAPARTLSLASASKHAALKREPIRVEEGLRWVGTDVSWPVTQGRFAFDNEGPRHRQWIEGFLLEGFPVNQGQFAEFIEAGGYRRPELWLSEGWNRIQEEGWEGPLYWERQGAGNFWQMTLEGMRRLEERAPVSHVSYFEADAYARWRGARLPTEFEWEVAFQESGEFSPRADSLRPVLRPSGDAPETGLGEVWEWTRSSYLPYPRYQPWPGGLGEYNGKFMCQQMVLRGASCWTPASHRRLSYRNFFSPETRWQCAGFRLAWPLAS